MGEWADVALGDVLTLQRGFDITKKQQKFGSIPVVSSSGIASFHDEAKVPGPGVVVGRKGSLGTVFFVNRSFWPHDTTLWVKDFNGNDPRFCYLLLKTLHLEELDAGASNPTLNRNHAHRLSVSCPDLQTQHRVASVLFAFDELIEINERRIEVLENLASSLYRYWFVNHRFPGHSDGERVDSELGSKPVGWQTGNLGDVVELRYGKALPARSRVPGDVPVVSSAGVIDRHDEAIVEGPGIVVGRKGNVGTVWWIEEDFFPIDTTYFVESDVPLGFLYWLLRGAKFIDSHAAVPGLSRAQALAVPIAIPPISLAERFSRAHETLFRQISVFREAIAKAAATRDLLLPRLVSGRLDISDIDLGVLTPSEPD